MRTERLLFLLVSCLCVSCPSGRDTGSGDDPDMRFPEYDGTGGECAAADHEGRQAPAALLAVLDRSASMAEGNKWIVAAQALVQALDRDVFDSMHIGLYAAPSGNRAGPACIFNLPVACQAPPFPQVDLKLAGADKSPAAAGVRRDIKTWLTQNSPDDGAGDASPLYAALQAAIGALQGWGQDGKRILFLVTDGTISCNQFSNRPGFADCNGCDHDWEDPLNIVKLLGDANKDPRKPIESFIVGVPGADTYDPMGCNYPPYRMRLALSAMAYAGAPKYVPPMCDGRTFSKDGADPKVSCHFDLTQGNFNADAVAQVMEQVRGQVLGCVYELPAPDGGVVDRDRVNVKYTTDAGAVDLYRRRDRANDCKDRGCWDYTPEGKIELIGKACDEVKGARDVKVRIAVGCATILG